MDLLFLPLLLLELRPARHEIMKSNRWLDLAFSFLEEDNLIMPAITAFRRQWNISSDDFVYPGIAMLFIRLLWYASASTRSHE